MVVDEELRRLILPQLVEWESIGSIQQNGQGGSGQNSGCNYVCLNKQAIGGNDMR